MFTLEVVKCSDSAHKARCLHEVWKAIYNACKAENERNGRKVTIRGEITDPCACHLDAAIYLASNGYSRPDCALGNLGYDSASMIERFYQGQRI